ncbi:MAG TPA: 50S ribosomal protein L25/general stress protein Ctc [Micromonosporaceae bacterium]
MSEVKISAEPRTEFGKGGARRTRRAGKVPAVLYGHGEAPKHIALPAREFAAAIRHGGINQIFSISFSDGSQMLALPKAIQRDPLKDTFEHVDLLIVKRGERVTVDVPVQLTGEAAKGTLVMLDNDRISLTADALRLPDNVEVSVEGLAAGQHVTAAQVKLPSGAELAGDPEMIVALVSLAPTAEQLEGEVAEAAEAAAPAPAEEEEAETAS